MSFEKNTVSKINECFPADNPVRVAVYHRAVKHSAEQPSKIESQEKHYQKLIGEQSNWVYSGIYADDGKDRVRFNAMIWEAKTGKIDLIITKSISRFSRNVADCISVTRDLLRLKKPVGIYFEIESICTLFPQTDMMLNLLSALAIAESENKGKHIGCIFPKKSPFNKK